MSGPNYVLVVISPFTFVGNGKAYNVGDEITDQDLIAEVLDSEQQLHVVRRALPAAPAA